MRAVVQRVSQASVRVDGDVGGSIDRGFLVLLGVTASDTTDIASKLAAKIAGLRIFEDADGRMNLGALLSRLECNDEAITEFRAAAALRPGEPEPHVYLALSYTLKKQYPEALAQARLARQIDPQASNTKLTEAVKLPPKESNLDEFIQFLERSAGG